MQHALVLPRKLAHRLRNCAARRRQACAGDPSGADLKIIALCDRLALDAERLPQAVIDDVARRCADAAFARRFDRVWDDLTEVVGVLHVPTSAADLVRWMIHQAGEDGPGTSDPVQPPLPSSTAAKPSLQMFRGTALLKTNSGSLPLRCAGDFTAALAVVGPMLALWEGAAALGQWRDQAFASAHPAITATVVSSSAMEAGRGVSPPATETLAFTLPGDALCRIAVPLGSRSPAIAGQSLTVVPRSTDCVAPLIPVAIGDPAMSLMVALAFAASGIAGLKAWSWLARRGTHSAAGASSRSVVLRVVA